MTYKAPADSRFLPLQFKKRIPRDKSWWAPIWRGLVVEHTGKHYRAMRSAIWLYLYFVVHADRGSGELFRRTATIAQDMGVKAATIGRWMAALRKHSYITSEKTGRALKITVLRWKRLRPPQK